MSELLQVRIEFPASEDQGGLTAQMLSDSVRSVFVEAGVGDDVVSAGIEEVSLEKATPLDIDPGTAAVLVASIGVGVELIKLGVDLMKQERELTLKEREVALKEQELEDQITSEKTEGSERKLLQEFVEGVLLARLLEQHGIRPITVTVQVVEER